MIRILGAALLLGLSCLAQSPGSSSDEWVSAPDLTRPLRLEAIRIGGVAFPGPAIHPHLDGNRGCGVYGVRSTFGQSFHEEEADKTRSSSAFGFEPTKFWAIFADTGGQRGRILFDEKSGRLRVSGTASYRRAARRFCAELAASLTPMIRVTILRLRAAGNAVPLGRLDRSAVADLERRLESGRGVSLRWRHEQSVRAGETLPCTRETPCHYLSDHNTAVWQAAAGTDPVVGRLDLGWRSRFRFYPADREDGAGLVLAGSLYRSRSERGPQRRKLDADRIHSLETLELRSCENRFALPLASGEAVSFDVAMEGEGGELLVVFAERDAAPGPVVWRVGQTPTRFLLHPWSGASLLRPETEPLCAALPSDPVPGPSLAEDLRDEIDSDDHRLELVASSGRSTAIRGHEVAVARFVARHRDRLAPFYRGGTLLLAKECRSGSGAEARWLRTGELLTLHLLNGRFACVHRGASQTYVRDWNADLNQHDPVVDPAVHGCFSGVSAVATLQADRGEDGGPVVHVRLLEQRLRGFRILPSSARSIGRTWLPRVETIKIQQALRFTGTEPQFVCEGVPLRRNGVSVRTRWRATYEESKN